MLILTAYSILLVLMFVLGFRPCYEGYFSENIGQCIKCPDNCVFCDSDKYCLTCANGYWGNVCERPCSECKEGTSCEKTNGFCLEKCKDGFTGLLCDAFCSATCVTCDRMNASLCEICLNKLQGKFCEKPCPQFCMNSSCNKTGYCIEDCENGYWGPICSELCPLGCKDKSCDRANGTCVNTGIDKENEQSWKADTGTLAVVSLVCVGSFMFVAVIICFVFYRCKIARCCEEGGQNNSDRENKRCIKKTKGDPEKKQPTVSTAEEAETLIQQIPAGQKGSSEFLYVSGFRGDNTYLVCQDPSAEQGDAFWEMVWQKNCNVIVKLSSSVEETGEQGLFLSKTKETQKHGSVSVTYIGGRDFDGYEERQYELEKVTERKQVKQMQFSHWPRGGFPENLPKLFEFRQKIEKVRTGLTGPLLIYCSGEQSRSYMYIALDRMLNELERGNNSDITVEQNLKRLRAEGLVSSNEQVSFLQKAVDIWRASRSTQTGKIVESKYPQIKGQDISNKEKCLSCLIDSHKAFPEHRHVFGFSGGNEYIICKDPTEKDAAAFGEMVWQQNCCVIVNLRTRNDMSSKNTYRYWPFNSRPTTYDSISVTTARTHNNACFIHRTLEMKKLNDKRQVTQMQFIDWLPGGIPKNRKDFLEFRQKVQELSKDRRGPLLVHCSDGKSRSGLFTASDMVLTDLERKNHVQHYLALIRGKDLELSENQSRFLSGIIELWKPSREEQTTDEKPAEKHYLDF